MIRVIVLFLFIENMLFALPLSAKVDEKYLLQAKVLILADEIKRYNINPDREYIQRFLDYKIVWDTTKFTTKDFLANNSRNTLITFINIYAVPDTSKGYYCMKPGDKQWRFHVVFFMNEQAEKANYIYRLCIFGDRIYKLHGFSDNDTKAIFWYLYTTYKANHHKTSFNWFCKNIDNLIKTENWDLGELCNKELH